MRQNLHGYWFQLQCVAVWTARFCIDAFNQLWMDINVSVAANTYRPFSLNNTFWQLFILHVYLEDNWGRSVSENSLEVLSVSMEQILSIGFPHHLNPMFPQPFSSVQPQETNPDPSPVGSIYSQTWVWKGGMIPILSAFCPCSYMAHNVSKAPWLKGSVREPRY